MDGVITVQNGNVESNVNIISGATGTSIANAIKDNAEGNTSPNIRDVIPFPRTPMNAEF